MNNSDILKAISKIASPVVLDELTQKLTNDWSLNLIDDAQAEAISQAIHIQRQSLKSNFTANRMKRLTRRPKNRDRQRSLHRRRTLAASGPMPPALAAHFTTGELATLRIVADEIRKNKNCSLYLGEIAARAGVGISTARRAIQIAAKLGYLTIQYRRQKGRPNLSNVIKIISLEWIAWIQHSQFKSHYTGSKKSESTDNHIKIIRFSPALHKSPFNKNRFSVKPLPFSCKR